MHREGSYVGSFQHGDQILGGGMARDIPLSSAEIIQVDESQPCKETGGSALLISNVSIQLGLFTTFAWSESFVGEGCIRACRRPAASTSTDPSSSAQMRTNASYSAHIGLRVIRTRLISPKSLTSRFASMHAAQVTSWGDKPAYVETNEPAAPTNDETVQVRLIATAIHQVVRARASGKHYTAKTLPHCPGVDGTGRLADGTAVYFETLSSGQGSFAEVISLPKRALRVLPEGLNPVTAAAIVNPGLSSWMAMRTRIDTAKLPKAFTVLILGATSASGTVAASLVRGLGAGHVIGVARSETKLNEVGLDTAIILKDDVTSTDFSGIGDVDVVLDYLYGAPMLHLLSSLNSSRPTQYVQIGSMAGLEASLPAAVLRSKDLTLRGAGPGSWSLKDMAGELEGVLKALVSAKPCEMRVEKLQDVTKVWDANDGGARIVFVP